MRSLLLLTLLGFPQVAHSDGNTPPDRPAYTGFRDRDPCIEHTDLVGYRRCTEYGEWGSNLLDPYTFLDLGANTRHLTSRRRGIARVIGVPTPPTGDSATVVTFDMRMGFAVNHIAYLALDTELGDFAAITPASSVTASRDVYVDGKLVFGLRGSIPLAMVRAELAAGGRHIEYDGADREPRNEAVLEARVRGEIWLSPWVTVGGVIGASLVTRDDWMAGLFIGIHTYSYAGGR
jgi:hypothetical protein